MPEYLEQIAPMAAEMIKNVMEALRKKTESVTAEDWTKISRDMENMEQALVQANAWRAQDLQGAVFLRVSCLVLAAYRVLESKYADKEELLDLLRRWLIEINFREGTDAFLKENFRISNEHPDTAWKTCAPATWTGFPPSMGRVGFTSRECETKGVFS